MNLDSKDWGGCALPEDFPFCTWGCTRLRSQEVLNCVWLGLLISSWRFLMKLLLPSTTAQSRDLALLASPWAEVIPPASITSLFSSSTDAQAGKLCQIKGALALEKSISLPFFGDLRALSQLVKSWFMIHGWEERLNQFWQQLG